MTSESKEEKLQTQLYVISSYIYGYDGFDVIGATLTKEKADIIAGNEARKIKQKLVDIYNSIEHISDFRSKDVNIFKIDEGYVICILQAINKDPTSFNCIDDFIESDSGQGDIYVIRYNLLKDNIDLIS